MELQEKLKQEAINLGACERGIESWGEPNLRDLCIKYFKYQDFCIEHNWPTLDEFKSVDQDELAKNGIFVQNARKADGMADMAVMGDAYVDIHVTRPCNITILHNGDVLLSVDEGVLCYVSMYDEAHLSVNKKVKGGRVAVSYWGGVIEDHELVDKVYYKTKKKDD